MVSEAEKLADRIRRALPNVKIGSLRFWGHWFGRPYDAWHQITRCEAEDNLLRIFFNEDEVLSVWGPSGLEVSRSTFRIHAADRVRWEWFYYGRPKTARNLCFLEFVRSDEGISSTTNVDSHSLDPTEPAVAIL